MFDYEYKFFVINCGPMSLKFVIIGKNITFDGWPFHLDKFLDNTSLSGLQY
jgi:hypothetical protein